MGQHGAACLGGGGERVEGRAVDRGGIGVLAGAKPAHLIRRGRAMTDEGGNKTGVEGVGAGAHILLFEDDDTLAGLLARVLRTEGYHVDVLDTADALPTGTKLGRYDGS